MPGYPENRPDLPSSATPPAPLTLAHAELIKAYERGFTDADRERWCVPGKIDPVTGLPYLSAEATRMLCEVWDAQDRGAVAGG